MSAAAVVWQGADRYRDELVPIDELEPWPGNPRRGSLEDIRASLRRFGQARPILLTGRRIVAGHHVVEAARAEGWTHVWAVESTFESEDEARAYLLADNRHSELGSVDDQLLAVQLQALASANVPLVGTGYDEATAAALVKLAGPPAFRPTDEEPPALDERARTTGVFEMPLQLSADVRHKFAAWVKQLEREGYAAGLTDVVVRAVREAAQRQ